MDEPFSGFGSQPVPQDPGRPSHDHDIHVGLVVVDCALRRCWNLELDSMVSPILINPVCIVVTESDSAARLSLEWVALGHWGLASFSRILH